MKDETMSQDQAFSVDNSKEETFKFDEPAEEKPEAPASQAKNSEKDTEDSEASSSPVGNEEEGQKVPYSRFKRKLDEINEYSSRIEQLEEKLKGYEVSKRESASEDVMPDQAWIDLYGDSEISKKAYKIQLQREAEIGKRMIEDTIRALEKKQTEDVKRIQENEAIIDDNIAELSSAIGTKLTAKQEEAVLSIVDEFSPVGQDGKYVSLFPFEKAWEIYNLRNSASTKPTQRARRAVAELTDGSSEGEVDSQSTHKRGWDNWQEAL